MGFLDRWFGGKSRHKARTRFVSEMAAAVLELEPAAEVEIVDGELRIDVRLPNDVGIFQVSLVNIWAEAERVGDADAVITHYAAEIVRTEELDAETLKQRLMPKLQPRRVTEQARLQHSNTVVDAMILREVTTNLSVLLAVDGERQITNVRLDQLQEFDISIDEAWALAYANLAERSDRSGFQELRSGLFTSTWCDAFDGARLVLPELIQSLDLRGDAIAVVPNRFQLLIADSAEPEALAELIVLAERMVQEDRPMQLNPLRLEGARWRWIDPITDDDLDPMLFGLSRYQAKCDYGFVEDYIADAHPELGRVSPISLREVHGMPITLAGGVFDSVITLPMVDFVLFADADGDEVVSLPWASLEAGLGAGFVEHQTWPLYFTISDPLSRERVKGLALDGARRYG